jgi:polyhydroxyalkanoate synthase
MPAASESQPATLDPMDLMNTTARLAQANLDLWMRAFTSPTQPAGDPLKIRGAGLKFATGLLQNPQALYDVQTQMWSDFMELSACMIGSGDCAKEEQKTDRRFRDPAWDDNPLFSCIKQSYFIASKGILKMVSEGGDMDPQARGRLMFATQQMIDALSPSNFVFTNPHVLQKAIDTQGKSLVDGVNHLLDDLERSPGRFDISMVEADAFELGVNIATTPGQVVYQNELMQLIQYSPSTDKVNRRPLLVIPPWMNKYYILDLRPDNSYLKWLVDQGHTVFVISWINPGKELAAKDIDDYMIEGPLAALEAIEQATGEKEVNVIGYCLGGILLSATLAWMAAKGDERIKSATLLTTMVDFAESGEVNIFMDEDGLDEITETIKEIGYLDGRAVYDTFRSLRANDLIWSFYVNNYLLGNPPGSFDLLHWNADATNMPAAIHTFCMHKLYRENLLREPGGINVAGVDLDVSKIKTPTYVLSAQDDHIAPWRTTYSTPLLFSGPVKFVLSESGHIAGVVNPPEKNKYGYKVKAQYPSDPQQWLDAATHHTGSWWPDWSRWVKPKAGGKVNARQPGDGKLQCIEAAPGSYVKKRI